MESLYIITIDDVSLKGSTTAPNPTIDHCSVYAGIQLWFIWMPNAHTNRPNSVTPDANDMAPASINIQMKFHSTNYSTVTNASFIYAKELYSFREPSQQKMKW